MLLNLSPESPTFDQQLHSLDSFDHYSSDMDVMSVGTDDQSVSDSPLEMSVQHQQQRQAQKQPKQQQDAGISPKKKRMRKTRAKVKSPELIQKLKTSRRQRANDRERNRMHGLNEALEVLRTTLPNSTDAKMTKIETLRYACNYISALAASVKLLEQNKNQDFGSELPNPDDYAFMLNFQYGEENVDDMSEHSPCPLTPMSRNGCNVDGSFNPHQQLQQQLHDNSVQLLHQQRGQLSHGMSCMDTPTSNVDNFLFPEQSGIQHMNSFSHALKQHQQHQQHQQQLQRNPAMSFSCFLNNQNKNRLSNQSYDTLLNPMGSNCDNYFEGSYPSASQPPMTPPTTYNTPPTSPDSHKQGNLQHQPQHQIAQVSQPMANSTSPNAFMCQRQHRDINLQHKHIPQFNVQAGNQSFSSSPLPIIPGQFL